MSNEVNLFDGDTPFVLRDELLTLDLLFFDSLDIGDLSSLSFTFALLYIKS
jgi:hypothetical protein